MSTPSQVHVCICARLLFEALHSRNGQYFVCKERHTYSHPGVCKEEACLPSTMLTWLVTSQL